MERNQYEYASKHALNPVHAVAGRYVLDHISNPEMMATVKNINMNYAKLVNDSVQQLGKFLINTSKEHQIFLIYMKNGIITSSKSALKPIGNKFPSNLEWGVSKDGTTFFATRVGSFFERLNTYQYNFKFNTWHNYLNTAIRTGGDSAACILGNFVVITGGTFSNTVDLLKIGSNSASNIQDCNTKLPVRNVYDHTITSIGSNKAILIGGIQDSYDGSVSSSVYQGILSKHENDIHWMPLPSMSKARVKHAAFKFGPNLHVIGGINDGSDVNGKSTEVYDIENQRWFNGPELPYPLSNPCAIEDSSETFVLIISSKGDKYCTYVPVIIFDNEYRFKELTQLKFRNFYGKPLVMSIR